MIDNEEPTTHKEVMELIRHERAALEATLSQLSEAQMLEPLEPEGWTVKDFLAHIAIWEQRLVQWARESLQGLIPQRPAPGMTWDDLDRLNETNYLESRNRPLSEVQAEFGRSHEQVLQLMAELTQEDLFEPQRFAWRNGDPLWHMVAANTWWHYREHNETLQKKLL
jgi:hypothetical protein